MSNQLKLAIEKDDGSQVLEELKKVNNINRALPGAGKPLEYACKKGSAKAVAVLLEAGAKINHDPGFTPFDIAAECNKVAVMEVLRQKKKVTPRQVDWALNRCLIDSRLKSVRFILEKFKRKITPRHFTLAMVRKSAPLVKLLLEQGGNINAIDAERDGDGMAPLHAEARGGDSKSIRLLVEHGADVNLRDRDGCTPLMHLASEMSFLVGGKRLEAIRALSTLLELGADASLKDKDGNDALTYYKRSQEKADPKVMQLLRKAGARGSGSTGELFEAIARGDVTGVKKALAQGADLSQIDPSGATPLTLAADEGSTKIVRILLDAGADPNPPCRSETPLIAAAGSGHLAVVKQLVVAGARIDDLEHGDDDDPSRRNALLAAQWNRKLEVVDYLKSVGAEQPKPTKWKPLKPGVANWDDFDELLVKADVETTAKALADLSGGQVQTNAYGKTFSPLQRAYAVVRPVNMDWSNVFQVAPIPVLFAYRVASFAEGLAAASGASVLMASYSDTADAADFQRFEPDGSSMGGSTSTEWLEKLAKKERFVLAAFGLDLEPGRPVDVEFIGYPAEAFDGVAIVG